MERQSSAGEIDPPWNEDLLFWLFWDESSFEIQDLKQLAFDSCAASLGSAGTRRTPLLQRKYRGTRAAPILQSSPKLKPLHCRLFLKSKLNWRRP